MAMVPGQTPGASEYCHGPGLYPHPNVDYSQGGKRDGFPVALPTLQNQLLQMLMEKRTDSADPNARLVYEGPDARGNLDRYGPNPAPVKTPGVTLGPTSIPEEAIGTVRGD